MPKARLIYVARIPIYKLVEENIESQANMREQTELLDKFNKWEVIEDELKAWIKRRMEVTSGEHRQDLAYILTKIEEIDKAQDEIILDIYFFSQRTYYINHLSNGLLKRFDVTGPYERRRKHAFGPLFRELRSSNRKSPSTV